MFFERRTAQLAAAIAVLSAATVGGAWIFQGLGYAPCELCLKGRVPHYAGIVLAVVTLGFAMMDRRKTLPIGFAGLAILYAAGAVFSIYHAGVEWHWWAGPSSCTGSYKGPEDVGSLLDQLKTVNVVRCDAPALHVLGLSLAVWNALICAGLAVLAGLGLRRTSKGF